MRLDEFITESIVTVMQAMRTTDERLREKRLGSVWLEDTRTTTPHLATLDIIKVGEEGEPSRLAFVFRFDVNVVADETTEVGLKAEAKLGGKVLQLFTAEASLTGGLKKTWSEKSA